MSKFNDYLKTTIFSLLIIFIAPRIISELYIKWSAGLESRNKIASICMTGNISGSSYYRKYLTHYFKDSSIKAILLNIESHSGAMGTCQALAFEIESLKKEYPKPIVAYIENICTSGAYEIAAATDYIVTTGAAVIGNIGSRITSIFDLEELIQQYHITHRQDDVIYTTSHNITSAYKNLTSEQQQMFQSITDNNYQRLCKEIASKRHLQLNKIDQWAQDKFFTGQQAYDLKLVDAIGSKITAINLIKKNIVPSNRNIEWVVAPLENVLDNWFTRHDEYNDL